MAAKLSKILALNLILAMLAMMLGSCAGVLGATEITIEGGDALYMTPGEWGLLKLEANSALFRGATWESSNPEVYISDSGDIYSDVEGNTIITVTYGELSDTIVVFFVDKGTDDTTPDDDDVDNDGDTDGDGSTGVDDNTDDDADTGNDNTTDGSNSGGDGSIGDGTTEDDNGSGDDTADGGNDDNTDDDSANDKNDGEDQKEEIAIPPDKYVNMSWDEFYDNYTPAVNYADALLRSAEGFMSGDVTVPDAAPTLPSYQPMSGDKYVRNTSTYFSDGGYTYTVVDGYGNAVLRVYKGGGYITLEEVAAYVYAFGEVPANYDSNKNKTTVSKSSKSEWGEYLRLNDSAFSGDTDRYPYEPVLPNISGCGGSLRYYEIDIGTTGTDTGTNHAVATYNNGTKITRGAARIVYVKYDGSTFLENPNDRYVFYTYNHYNDFQEYLNYYGGWGEIFGNITGGGTLSSKYDYAPTPYVPTYLYEIGIITEVTVAIPETAGKRY